MVSKRIAIIAGEASGDMHGAALAQNLKSIEPDVVLAGIGGERMAQAGVRLWADPTRLSAVGLVEVIAKVGVFQRLFRDTMREITSMRPDVVVLIDYPGFNMRLGDRVHDLGIPCVYYIPPTAWAWGRKRADRVAAFASKVLSIFPFEIDVYRRAGADVEFVGHPLVDSMDPSWIFERQPPHMSGVRTIGLFPGSRDQEIDSLLPTMLQSCRIARETDPDLVVELSVAPTVDEQRVLRHVSESGLAVRLCTDKAPSLMRRCYAGIVASGTATLEAALIGMPMVIVYRVSRLTAAVFRRLLTLSDIGLPNIVLGRRIVPELVQEDFVPARVAAELSRYCSDLDYYNRTVSELAAVRGMLGERGASGRAARLVLDVAHRSDKAGVVHA
jgi:lipid-A-disaccharide synthase